MEYFYYLIAFALFLYISLHFKNRKPPKSKFEKFKESINDKIFQKPKPAGSLSNSLLFIGSTILFFSGLPILAGFGTTGIVGGSLAAFIQSVVGNVAAGSYFATFTSIGMQGYFITGAWIGGITTSLGGLSKLF
jgi:hypothetical protein